MSDYVDLFVRSYSDPSKALVVVPSSVPVTSPAGLATAQSINMMLFGVNSESKALAIYTGSQTMGLFESLITIDLKDTRIFSDVTTLLTAKDFSTNMLEVHSKAITAAVAYDLLRTMPIRPYTATDVTAAVDRVYTSYKKAAADRIRVFLLVLYAVNPAGNRFNPWILKPELKEDERGGIYTPTSSELNLKIREILDSKEWPATDPTMAIGSAIVASGIVPNNSAFYKAWAGYLFANGIPQLIGSIRIAYATNSLIAAGQNPSTLEKATAISAVILAFADTISETYYTNTFAESLMSALLNSIQNPTFRNIMFTGGLGLMAPLFYMYNVIYGAFSWTYVGAGLARIMFILLKDMRDRGRVATEDLHNQEVAAELANIQNQIVATIKGPRFPSAYRFLLIMVRRAYDELRGAIEMPAMGTVTVRPPTEFFIEDYAKQVDLLTDEKLTLTKNREELKNAFSRLLVDIGMLPADVDKVLAAMSRRGSFTFYSDSTDEVSLTLYNELLKARETIYAFYEELFKRKGYETADDRVQLALGALMDFTTRFGSRTGSVFNRMSANKKYGRQDWISLFASLFGIAPSLIPQAFAQQTFNYDEEEPGVNRDTFANEIIKFTPDWSLDHIAASDMPANYRWFAYKRRRQEIMDSFSAIFQAMGASKEDTDAALNSLVNNGGFRSNGRHGSYPDFVAFLTKYSDTFKAFFARYPVDQRIQYGAIFCSRFFGLRGRTVLISKIFDLTYSDYRKLAQQTVPIDPVKMDFTWQDGDRPSGPEPTAAQLSAYERPTRKPVSRGGEL